MAIIGYCLVYSCNYRVIRIFTIIVLCFVSGCERNGYKLTPEQQVYEFVFNEALHNATKEVLILETTSTGRVKNLELNDLLSKYAELKEFPDQLLGKIVKNAKVEYPLDWKPILVNGKLISSDQYKSEEGNQFWAEFYKLYPRAGGYYSVSKVAFDSGNKEAVMVFSYHCAAICGAHDSLLYLKRIGAKWSLVTGLRLWVS